MTPDEKLIAAIRAASLKIVLRNRPWWIECTLNQARAVVRELGHIKRRREVAIREHQEMLASLDERVAFAQSVCKHWSRTGVGSPDIWICNTCGAEVERPSERANQQETGT